MLPAINFPSDLFTAFCVMLWFVCVCAFFSGGGGGGGGCSF